MAAPGGKVDEKAASTPEDRTARLAKQVCGADGAAVRKPWVGGNWKCNGTKVSITEIIEWMNKDGDLPVRDVDVVVAPPGLYIPFTLSKLRGDVIIAAQNICAKAAGGAFTGEMSIAMLKDWGIKTVILGHSERRHIFSESNGDVAMKVKAAVDSNLDVVLCIGETLKDRDEGKTEAIVTEQLAAVSAAIKPEQWGSIVIAYEPVWAIGTGRTATPEQAQEVHAHLRSWMARSVSDSTAKSIRIVYGGSVKAANAAGIIAKPDIDGFLVGGAALKPEWGSIVRHGAGL